MLTDLTLPYEFMQQLNENQMYFNINKLALCHLKYRFIRKYMGSFAASSSGQFIPFIYTLIDNHQSKQVLQFTPDEFFMILDIVVFQTENMSNVALSKDIKTFTIMLLTSIKRISSRLSIAGLVMYYQKMQPLQIDLTFFVEQIMERQREIVVTKESTEVVKTIISILMKECQGVLLYNKIEAISKNYRQQYVELIEKLTNQIIAFDHTVIMIVFPIIHDLRIKKRDLQSIYQIYLTDILNSVEPLPQLPQYCQFMQFCHFNSFPVEQNAETILEKLIPFISQNKQLQFAELLYRLTHIITSNNYKCRTEVFSQLKPKLQRFYKEYTIKNTGPCNVIDTRVKYMILLGFLIRSPLKNPILSNFNFFLNDYLLNSINVMVDQEVIVALAHTKKVKASKKIINEAIPKLFQNVSSLCIYCNSTDKTYLNPRYAPHFNALLDAALQYSDFKPSENLQHYLFVQTLFKKCYKERTHDQFLTVLNLTGQVSNLCPELKEALKNIVFADDLDIAQKILIDNFLIQDSTHEIEESRKKKVKPLKKEAFRGKKVKQNGSNKQFLNQAVQKLKEKEGIDKQVIQALRNKNIESKQLANIFANKQVYADLLIEGGLDPNCHIPEPLGKDKYVDMAYICLKIYLKIRKANDFGVESFISEKEFTPVSFQEELEFIQRKGTIQMISLNSFHIQKRILKFLPKLEVWNTHYKVNPEIEIKELALDHQLLEEVLQRVVFGVMGNQEHLLLACQFFKISSKLAYIMTGRPYTATGALIETGNLKLFSADKHSYKLIYICAYLLARKGFPVCVTNQNDDFGKLKRYVTSKYPIEDEIMSATQINDYISTREPSE